MQEITKIVITGGPCAGKSTAMSWIQNEFSAKGYTVLFVPETATEFITGGVAPWTCGTNLDYQKCQMLLQQTKERLFERAARTMTGEKILIVCDRGQLDNRAYMNEAEFAECLKELGTNEVELRDGYDGVFHLVTAAKGAEQFYTYANNAARYESIDEAIAMDDRVIAAWTGHPHLRVIDNSFNFEDKMKQLMSEIASLLGESAPLEIERKYLIEKPDVAWLEQQPNCQRVEILQTYIKSPDNREIRVRQRGQDGNYLYFVTEKQTVDDNGLKRIEVERRLTQREYVRMLMDADEERMPLRKTRYCLTYKTQYFEIDIFPFMADKAIAEIELASEDTPVEFPKELHVIREVTGEAAYKSASLALIK